MAASQHAGGRVPVPRDRDNDYPPEAAQARLEFARAAGNIEQFIGDAQVPIGALFMAAFVHTELRDNGDYYYSVTIPSLIVATYGGGTGLATQRECLEMLDCYGSGKVNKFAEIVAATVLCGELSLGSAIVAEEWVEAHDLYGRNRP